MERFDTPAQRLAEACRADWHDQEFLEINVVVGVDAAVQDVHLRGGQQAGDGSTEVLIQREAQFIGHGTSSSHRDGQDRVCAQVTLGRRAIELDHGIVQLTLLAGIGALEFGRNHVVDIVDRLEHALAQVTALVAVAQLQCFVLAGGGSAGHRSPAARSTA